ncbi:helix-turn-helix transcriptional regulator [Actinoplanes teichomyceticus]|uniref:Regulatory LuxR family protein n=1 Tax=Actinoplanes teichomyceticus TaxID=1867 RepID=A0A561WMH0_ACTTI|nr:AAA family ATPase [Actinoplanes teichomyceticus]TWG25043.1 regulatory LuxR family protein [Actinoplanes teichomyceticus]GIF10114.1 transcriptional regulator [Actinoplanes teichomyceticus]
MDLDLDAPGLIGRAGVWAELVALLGPERSDGAGALLVGPAGIGKTTLVDRFAEHARQRGLPVLRATGESGAEAYSVLRALFGGARLDDLPGGQHRALHAALTGASAGPDLLALRAAVCAAASLLAGDRTLVLAVDDVDRTDPPSLDLLLTLTSVLSWRQLPVVALFAARTERAPVELAELVRQIPVPPLTDREAERLLDRLGAPAGATRLEVLRRAAGNPLALHEYGAGPGTPAEAGVAEMFARRVRDLPEVSRHALTLAAAGERSVTALARAEPAVTLAAWQPAEEAGLVTVTDAVVRFRHPLVEFAVFDTAGVDARRRAHRILARASADPRRALWHRAEAADGVDPQLAAELIAAARTLDGAAAVTAIGLLEQAGDRLPAAGRAPVLLEAAARAAAVGRIRWAADIAARARAALTPDADPAMRAGLDALASWVLTMRGRVADAAALLTGALTGSDPAAPPATLIDTAALPAFLLGSGPLHEALGAALLAAGGGNPLALALVRPDERVRAAIRDVPDPVTAAQLGPAAVAGAAAMLLDEPEEALRLLTPGVRAAVGGTAASVILTAPGAACWALIDTGRWVEAERWLVPLLASPVTAEATMVRAGAQVQLAVIGAGRGRAEPELAEPAEPALRLRLGWARGVAAAAAGEHREAYRRLRAAVEIPHPWQPLLLPDLIVAAGHAGRTAQARAIHERLREAYRGSWLTARTRSRLAAADALLVPDPAHGARRLSAVLDAPGADRWPFERAVLAVELADRLRRAQQPARARDVLVGALDTFERLRAAAWTARVHTDLRIATAPTEGDRFAGLSAQQEQIVRLAARGLTNREIGERLFLSPRTVGSHLYRLFPQLGVTNRTQLGDLVAALDRRAPRDPRRAADGPAPKGQP